MRNVPLNPGCVQNAPLESRRREDGWVTPERRRLVNAATLATPLGLALARLGRAAVVRGPDGLLLATDYDSPFPAPRATAVTVGDVVLLRMSRERALDNPRLLRHEAVHAAQWARWPLVFLPAYGLASLWSMVRNGDAATGNCFEISAGLSDGGYTKRGRRGRQGL